MNNSELLKLLAQRTGLTLKETKQLLKQTVGVFSETLGNYMGFSIPDLGTFGTHIREARQAFDLNRKAHVLLPPKRLVSFSPAVGLKEEIREIGVEPPAPRPSTEAPKETAPGAEASPEDQEAAPDESRESLRRELQADLAEETTEQTPEDVPTPPEEISTEGAAQPEAASPEPVDAPEPASDEDQVTEQPEPGVPVPDPAIAEPAVTPEPEVVPEPASQGEQALPQPPDSDEPPPEAENPEPEKQP